MKRKINIVVPVALAMVLAPATGAPDNSTRAQSCNPALAITVFFLGYKAFNHVIGGLTAVTAVSFDLAEFLPNWLVRLGLLKDSC